MRTHFLAPAVLVLALSLAVQPAVAGVEEVFDALPDSSERGDIRLLTDNHEAWYARWNLMERAQTTLDCTYFSATTDIIGRAFLGMLARKAAAGVKVRLMVDLRGSLPLFNPIFHQDYLPALASLPGVQVKVYNAYQRGLSLVPAALLSGIASNHSKMLIADGSLVVAGGRNLKVPWFTSPSDDSHAITDADVVCGGAGVAAQATRVFLTEFAGMRNLQIRPLPPAEAAKVLARLETARAALHAHMTRQNVTVVETADDTLAGIEKELEPFRSMRSYERFRLFPVLQERPRMVVLGKGSAANPGQNPITDTLVRFIDAAESEIEIGSAYMVLTDRARAALKAASARGVRIRVLTNSPESTGSLLTQAWFVKEWKDYMRELPTMRLFAIAEKRKLHGKVFVFDHKVSVVGSYNMDPMSEQINGEQVAVIRSRVFSWRLEAWLALVKFSAIEYEIRRHSDGTVSQVVGPSDHCSRTVLWLLKLIGSFSFLRPMV